MSLTFYLCLAGVAILLVLCIIGLSRGIKEFSNEFGVSHITDIHYNPTDKILYFKGGSGMEYTFRGSCTVWYHLDGKRCHTILETSLSEIWHKWKYEQKI